MRLLSEARHLVNRLLLPQACVLCDDWRSVRDLIPLCPQCRRTLRPLRGPQCNRCGDLLPGPPDRPLGCCGSCRRRAPHFERGLAWGAYRGPLRQLIRHFKYGGNQRLRKPLGELLLAAWLHSGIDLPDLILPVPSHPSRVRSRGFDPAGLLASDLAAELRLPLLEGVRRLRATAPQFGLDERARRQNLRGAFGVAPGVDLEERSLLIVDDILTTGTTAGELARVLRKAGAGKIFVLVVARAIRHSGGC